MFKKIGPGILIAAAFIGPGTITVCTIAGVNFGFGLLWAMLLSVVATVVLQEMAARLGLVTNQGISTLIKSQIKTPWLRSIIIITILAAIVLGNTAYEAGNISGATLGLEAIFGEKWLSYYPWIIGLFAFLLLFWSSYKALERVFVFLVGLMSIAFILTAIITKPDLYAIAKGLLLPSFPADSMLTVLALIGTTVVPYNLFLHASLVREKWNSADDINTARNDTLLSVMLGGFVSMTIIIAATSIPLKEVTNASDLAYGLEPLFGNAARYFMGIGLFAAGITSAITAPLAAAYVANHCFGWNADLKDWRFRSVWITILLVGLLSLSLQFRPIQIIQFAQVANGLLLPIIAIILLWLVNKKEIMSRYRNTIWNNVLAMLIILLVIVLGIKSIFGI